MCPSSQVGMSCTLPNLRTKPPVKPGLCQAPWSFGKPWHHTVSHRHSRLHTLPMQPAIWPQRSRLSWNVPCRAQWWEEHTHGKELLSRGKAPQDIRHLHQTTQQQPPTSDLWGGSSSENYTLGMHNGCGFSKVLRELGTRRLQLLAVQV